MKTIHKSFKEITVLSLFDGMSCAQQALERVDIPVSKYYASEIDKPAIKVTQKNYPNTIQLGSVVDIDVSKLDFVDALFGGSPCQSFSFAGKRKGMITKGEVEILTLEHYLQLKSEGYEFEGQSYLFWEYMRILTDLRKINPDVIFLLENVMMGDKWEKILSKAIGVNPICINSALVSAQNRNRLYWTNIGLTPQGLFGEMYSSIEQPKDKKIFLKDILEEEVDEKYYLSQERVETMLKNDRSRLSEVTDEKVGSLLANQYKQSSDMLAIVVHNMMPRSSKSGKGGTGHLTRTDGKTYCLDTGSTNAIEIVAMRGRGEKGDIKQKLEYNGTGKSNSLTTVQKDNLVLESKRGIIKFGRTLEAKKIRKESMAKGVDFTPFADKEISGIDTEKSGTLTTVHKDNLVIQINPSKESGGKCPYQQNRIYDPEGSTNAIEIVRGRGTHAILHTKSTIRRLTEIECERLQTVRDGYTDCLSATQRYRVLGNGWTIDVICHILSYYCPPSDK